MAEFEEKFIVINRKHIDELIKHGDENPTASGAQIRVKDLFEALDYFSIAYRGFVGKELDQKYYVCNQDEPYAQKVLDTIIDGENLKEIEDKFKDVEIDLTHRRL